VGTSDSGTEVLIDLEGPGVTMVSGDPRRTVDLLRAMAVATASTPWAGHPRVVLVGLSGDLSSLPFVESMPALRDALDAGIARTDETATALRGLRCPTLAQARAAGATPDAWEPLVILSAVAPHDLDAQLLSTLAAHPRHAVAVVCPQGTSPLPGRVIEVDEHGWLRMAGLDVGVRARRLAEDDTRVVADLLTLATHLQSSPHPDNTPSVRTPAPTTPTPPTPSAGVLDPEESSLDALRAEVDVLVRVLGDVDVMRLQPDGRDERLTATKQKAIEAIAYLALREGSVHREDVQAALWPSGANSAQTFKNAIWEARRALGGGRDGPLLPQPSGGRYDLSERVVTDYGLFYELTHRAEDTDDALAAAGLLTEALTLVRGEPLVGVGRGYGWVGSHRGIIVAQIVDAAEELAEVRLATGDWRSAEWAARQGLRAMPCDERLYRLLMRTAHAAGNVPGVHQVFRELCDAVADPDTGAEPEDTLHPETIALYEELTGTPRPQPSRVTA
ncbi:MAG: AfsR/SARP family transcriptional regulator, partial [Acidimicrobiales bacterium]